MITVWSGSAAFRWRIRATKAFLSASSVAGKCGDSEFLTLALGLITRGKALVVQLDPLGRVLRAVVLPGAEPQQHQRTSFSRACFSSTSR
jgi:hypothetical protein